MSTVHQLPVTMRGGGRDDCRTPRDFFNAASILAGGFAVDAAAFADTCLVQRRDFGGNPSIPWYFGPDHEFEARRDALNPEVSWCESGENAWLNPPYGRLLQKFVKAANHQARVYGVTPWLLVPARTDTEWWSELMQLARNVHFVRGRLWFLNRDGTPFVSAKGEPTAAGFPSALVEVHRFGGHPRVVWGWRWDRLDRVKP